MKTAGVAFLGLVLSLLVVNIATAQNWQTVYQTDFSSDPGWTTNNASYHYWDSSDGTYYVKQLNVNYGGYYAYYDAGYNGGSFRLEWDIRVDSETGPSGLNFRLSDDNLDIESDTSFYVFLVFGSDNKIHMNYCNLDSVGHAHNLGTFSFGQWLHAVIEYDSDAGTLSVEVREIGSASLLVSTVAYGAGPFPADMNRLATTNYRPNGSHACSGCYTQGKFDNVSFALEAESPSLAHVDIKPGSCPNPINISRNWDKSKAVLPVAVLGSEGFDVAEIDPTTIMLEGVPPLRWSVEDVSTSLGPDPEECECNTLAGDGYPDLTLKFLRAEIVGTLSGIQDGDVIPLTLTGITFDGIQFEGMDCVIMRAEGNYAPRIEDGSAVPAEFALSHNYPNPFNPSTEIGFSLPEATQVKLKVYNIMGQEVTTLVDMQLEAGEHTAIWDGTEAASGIYLYRLKAGDFIDTKKMILLK